MHAALITGKGRVELVEFDEPEPFDGGVVVDIAFCGVCGTDVHAYQSGRPYTPAICGHEWAGTVSAVGANVRALAEGDRVVVAAPPACARCSACLAGHAERCEQAFRMLVGRDERAPKHGGFAPRIAVAAERVERAHPALSDEEAAQVEPATVAFHAVRHSRLRLGDTAVVQGAGPIGLSTLQFVRAAGAGHIIVIEPNADRRALATRLGAHETVEPGAPAAELVAERTSGLGGDVVFECVGRPDAIQTAVDLSRRGGAMCLIGLADENASINPGAWLRKEITVILIDPRP
jgi:(R,R)-butanediol dehydrogenase/meso-butanediol dehydrogenase/diacetyl reductase